MGFPAGISSLPGCGGALPLTLPNRAMPCGALWAPPSKASFIESSATITQRLVVIRTSLSFTCTCTSEIHRRVHQGISAGLVDISDALTVDSVTRYSLKPHKPGSPVWTRHAHVVLKGCIARPARGALAKLAVHKEREATQSTRTTSRIFDLINRSLQSL